MDLENIRNDFLEKIAGIDSIEAIKDIRFEFVGSESVISKLMKSLQSLSLEDKRTFGTEINNLKNFFLAEISKQKSLILDEKIKRELENKGLDVTLPVREENFGLIHPMVKVQKELRDILYSMGFSFTSGSEIENDWNCFEGLNIPKHHPARQMQDTFYLKNDNDGIVLLRTQTTTMEVREMTKNKPPFKFCCTGKVFRSEMDATHCPMFHQLEGVFVNKSINMQDLKDCLTTICKKFFGLKELPLRFRPSYFPFTSPSVEVDIRCKKQEGKITLGEGDDWIEVLGAGMLHPNVLRNVNIDIDEYQGFAFGLGIERMAMLKYGVRDMRNMYDGDIRFLKQYGFKIFE
ncbi:MAG: phenylalanine--tRNA ligase subunit alpha [Rickettsiales bacterium]|jgi:phenylalanyl-tRNA synthetase alpha chain|nr:phenylalanine--tRNA ligase subunit alpha [Rickettsiales bacterium]